MILSVKVLKSVCLLLITSFIFGCATTSTGPIEIDDGVYIMSRKEGAFPLGLEPLLEETIEEAKTFCATKNKKIKVTEFHENEGPFIWGNYPKATVTFTCE